MINQMLKKISNNYLVFKGLLLRVVDKYNCFSFSILPIKRKKVKLFNL